MAAKIYASRAFVEINGFEAVDCKTATLTINENMSRVSTMSRDRNDAGFKYGNRSIQVKLGLFVQGDRAQIDVALADESKDVNVVFIAGGERYTVKDCRQGEMDLDGSVGDLSKNITLEGLQAVNENGTPVNLDISLG